MIKVLVLIDWYLPGYKAGGPIQSVANIISHLKNDFDFSVITSDTDLSEQLPYKGITGNDWNITADRTPVYYFSKEQQTYNNLKRLLLSQQFDVIYTNSFFSGFFTIYPLLIVKREKIKCKIIIAPRGMLGEGALKIKSFKKKVFIRAVKFTRLYNNVTWHASTEVERDEIKKVFGSKAHIVVALNLSKPRIIKKVNRIKQVNNLRLVFLSRISIKKNLIAVYRYLAAMDVSMQIVFDYFGTVDDKVYSDECAKLFSSLPGNIKANYKGVLKPEDISDTLSQYHFSILPTFNENFGHSIVDSWAAGCPVIISDQTPWKNLEQKKCGWDLPLNDDDAFISVIKKCFGMQQNEFNQWSDAAYNYVEHIIKNPEATEQNKKLFAV